MNARRSILAVATAAILAACGTGGPDLGALESDLQGLVSTPGPRASGATAAPGGQGQPGSTAAAGASAPPAGPPGTIRGTLTTVATGTYASEDGLTTDDNRWESVVNVDLVREPDSEEDYVDAGSTYSMNWTSTAKRVTNTCTSLNEKQSDTSTYKFTDTPTADYQNEITASVLRDDGVVLLFILMSYPFQQTTSGCSTSSSSDGQGTSIDCGTIVGLQLALIEGSQTDQIDGNCSDTGTTVTGTLTLTH